MATITLVLLIADLLVFKLLQLSSRSLVLHPQKVFESLFGLDTGPFYIKFDMYFQLQSKIGGLKKSLIIAYFFPQPP
jgi:hypothetical protein